MELDDVGRHLVIEKRVKGLALADLDERARERIGVDGTAELPYLSELENAQVSGVKHDLVHEQTIGGRGGPGGWCDVEVIYRTFIESTALRRAGAAARAR